MHQASRINLNQSQRLHLSGSLMTALKLMRFDALGLSLYLLDQAQEVPALRLRPAEIQPGAWLPRWTQIWGQGRGDAMSSLIAPAPGLIGHVLHALPGLVPSGAERRIAIALTEALAPTGWLERPLSTIAAELSERVSLVEHVLAKLQRIDPAGLFARDLTECLRLQALEAQVLDPVMEVMLQRLDLLAAGDFAPLARLAGVEPSQIVHRFRLIRSFHPKPGTLFGPVSSPQREPDLLATPSEGGWLISHNRSALPVLSLDDTAQGAAKAQHLIRLVEARNSTLLVVAQSLLAHQRPALDHGTSALRPLTMQQLAERLSLHKSTISRVVAGASIDTPHGTWWLRSLFSADVGADLSAAALRAQLARLVGDEDRARPLSDEAIARALSSGGVVLARRTVAKYRAQLRIPSCHRRRLPA